MRLAAAFVLALLLAGCGSPAPGPEPTLTATTTETAPSSTSMPTAMQPPEPAWNFTLPGLPPATASEANVWERGADLGPDWRVEDDASAGRYQLVWLVSDIDRDPAPGSACGVSMGTQTDFDVQNHAVRTAAGRVRFAPALAPGLLSASYRDGSTGCAGKSHWSLHANGTAWNGWGNWDPDPPVVVAANGSALVAGAGLWLRPGQTVAFRTDRWENRSAESAALQPPQPTSVHVTGLTRVVHLGSWDAERVWHIEQNRCGDEPDRSRNCIGIGDGP